MHYNNKSYPIKPGLQVVIPKNTHYQIKSKDPKSFRVYKKTKIISYPSIKTEKKEKSLASSVKDKKKLIYLSLAIFLSGFFYWEYKELAFNRTDVSTIIQAVIKKQLFNIVFCLPGFLIGKQVTTILAVIQFKKTGNYIYIVANFVLLTLLAYAYIYKQDDWFLAPQDIEFLKKDLKNFNDFKEEVKKELNIILLITLAINGSLFLLTVFGKEHLFSWIAKNKAIEKWLPYISVVVAIILNYFGILVIFIPNLFLIFDISNETLKSIVFAYVLVHLFKWFEEIHINLQDENPNSDTWRGEGEFGDPGMQFFDEPITMVPINSKTRLIFSLFIPILFIKENKFIKYKLLVFTLLHILTTRIYFFNSLSILNFMGIVDLLYIAGNTFDLKRLDILGRGMKTGFGYSWLNRNIFIYFSRIGSIQLKWKYIYGSLISYITDVGNLLLINYILKTEKPYMYSYYLFFHFVCFGLFVPNIIHIPRHPSVNWKIITEAFLVYFLKYFDYNVSELSYIWLCLGLVIITFFEYLPFFEINKFPIYKKLGIKKKGKI
jgi:hypothetical protein